MITVENEDTWRYCINCISWSNWSCIFDIMWIHDVRVHGTIVFFYKSVWKTTKLWIWKDVNSVPFLCEDKNPTNGFFSSFESSSNNLLDKCTRPLGLPQVDMRGLRSVPSWGYKYYDYSWRSNGCDTKMEIMRLRKGLQNEESNRWVLCKIIIRNSTMSLTTLVLCFFYLSNMLLGS